MRLLGAIGLLIIIVVSQHIAVHNLEEELSVCHTELCNHCTSGEHCPMHLDVMAIGPLTDPPVLEVAIEGLVA